MTFGKPRLTSKPVRCIECGAEYPENHIELKHAGRIHAGDAGTADAGDYWNSKCPECGTMNGMQEEYADLTETEFRVKQHEVARQRRRMRKEQKRRRQGAA